MQGKRHTVWITPAEKLETLRRIAQKRNLSLNAAINQALDEFIDRHSEETAAATPTTSKQSRKREQKHEGSQPSPEDAGEVASGSKDPDPEDAAKEPFYLEPDGRIVGRWGRKEGRLIGYFTSLAEAERAVRS